ncbi:G-type lectin S-receptor-like serine/threonine-protein kinase At4g27290 [Camellia sinensis]|uniref:G-type lectin S-receptor-like serine/threonine-protein kinase At4g27290 n=1 Tax=Camellia sinensis TaxID=4442 RepID=UPI0010362913|nr:G-type lectin S-receptor-like serine/threonine-protein kinase At4g27290 [Camellia sinensis]
MNSTKLEISLLMEGLKIPLLFSSLFSILIISNAADTITKTHSIYGNNTIVSSGGSFEMGFFSPDNSRNQYLGIWCKKISVRTVVWVANREIPLVDSSGVLKIIDPGILALVDGTSNTIWAANVTRSTQDTVAQLMDSGNLVVKDANDDNPEHFLWQSFDYPGDTFLPGMKLGKNFVTGLELKLSSWKSSDDPAKGEFTYWCDPRGYPQFFLNNSSVKFYRTGPWNGIGFSTTRVWHNSAYTLELVVTMDERDETQEWVRFLLFPTENCDTYNLCGVNGICNVGNSPACSCLSKFVPQNQTEWGNGDWSNGCVRRTPLDCHNGDKFLKYSGNKLLDTRCSWFNTITTLRECEKLCLNNCSCTAYTNLDIRQGGSGCLLWFDELIDMRQYSEDGQDIYIRMASSELGENSFQTPSSSGFTKHTIPVL